MAIHYSPKLAKKICALVSQGFTIAKACESPGMPSSVSVYGWLGLHSEFSEWYTEAKIKQMEVWGEQIIDLTDNCPRDADAVAKAKLQVYARQWVMAKLKPKKYGERTTIAGDKDNPLTVNLSHALDTAILARARGKTIENGPLDDNNLLSQATGFGSVNGKRKEFSNLETPTLPPIEIDQDDS